MKTLRLLLHLGANANANDGNHPLLHTAADREDHLRTLMREKDSNKMEFTPAHLLFDYGANPYHLNDGGKSAVDVWVEKNCGGQGMESEAWNRRPHWCRNTVPKLMCLAAKTIHTHAISYSPSGEQENHPHSIAKELYDFLEAH